MQEKIPPDPQSSEPLCPVVVIGASAGGLKALESFLSELPAEFFFSVIFMQHLPPTHRSLMPELLRSQRPDLAIEEMTEGKRLLPGHVYLYAPDKEIRISQDTISARPITADTKHLPIDDFLISLSEYEAERIIAVILSGAGTDGARGVKAIKAAGGTVFIQEPVTAEFQGMPLAAINTGQIDGVLPPAEIARKILSIAECSANQQAAGELITPEQFEPLFHLLYDKTGLRFSHYKRSVVERRMRRRLHLHGLRTIVEYLDMLTRDVTEAELLASDFLIGVTSFFRDRLAWTALQKEVIVPLIESSFDSPVRIWVPACATGEEVYSIAMMLRDTLDSAGLKRDIQIFASDVNEHSLEKARAAVYPASTSADIPQGYLDKFVTYTSDGFAIHIDSRLRDYMVFAKHDVITDPPFSRMDLIVCRNLLIYLESHAQEKCISLFNYALNDVGYLFLGSAESLGASSPFFNTVGNKKNRIVRKIPGGSGIKKPLPAPFVYKYSSLAHQQSAVTPQAKPSAADLAQKALVTRFAPAAVAITGDYEIVYFNGPTHTFLKQPEGPPTQNLLDLLPDNLRSRIRGGLYKVIHDNKPAAMHAALVSDKGIKRQITINISAITETLFLVTFSAKGGRAGAEEPPQETSQLDETSMRQLENELCATREDLQSHIEQLESLSEELQSSNEELQASNEELETSKEELQSLNEELLTVNAQLQNKIEELDETNDDLINFISSTNIPTLFLDRQLKVRRFTPAMAGFITLIQADIGRSISDMSQSGLGPDLISDVKTVLSDDVTLRAEIQVENAWYMRTILPYRTTLGKIDGAVITYNDVTEIKNAEQHSKFLASFPQINPNPVLEVSPSGVVTFANPAAIAIISNSGISGLDVSAFLPADFVPLVADLTSRKELTYYREVRLGSRIFGETVHLLPQFNVARIYAFDITQRQKAREALQKSEARYRELVQNANSAIIRWSADGAITFFNEYAESFFGYRSEEVIGRPVTLLVPDRESTGRDLSDLIQDILARPENYAHSINENVCSDGRRVWMDWTNKPIFGPDGKVTEIFAVGSDVTERKHAEEALRNSEELYRSLFDNMLNGFAYCKMIFEGDDPKDFTYLAVNKAFIKLTGLQNVTGRRVTEIIPGIKESDPELFDIYGKVATTGIPKHFEFHVEALDMWFDISVYSPKKEHFVAVFDVITERKRAEEELSRNREQLSLILHSTAEGIYGLDLEGRCTFCNASGVSMLGYKSEGDLIGKYIHDLIHHTRSDGSHFPKEECFARIAISTGEHVHRNKELLWRADGTNFQAEYWAHPIYKDGALIGAVVAFVDISERVSLENQLLQSQKMEVVGQLAGGIAHDFNNLLTAITGHGYLLQSKIPPDDPRRSDVEQILESADRAAEVTRSLLAFSRQETMNMQPVKINELVLRFEKLLRRIIGEEIEVGTVLSAEEIFSTADSNCIEQVLMNLATNARDAMPRGGRLIIRTGRADLTASSLPSEQPVVPGTYAVISISDNGSGISPDILPKIFEPFFTTKEPGKGTGLGLSMVYGILKQHEGYVKVETEQGNGTTFKVYLPVSGPGKDDEHKKSSDSEPEGGPETILVAEDDDKLRTLFGVVLAKYGYQTIFASDGEEAIAKFTENKDKVDLMLMDMIMPRKNGMEAYSEINKMRPDLKIIFLSGYTADRIDVDILHHEGVHLILKPVSPKDLLKKVREVLEQ